MRKFLILFILLLSKGFIRAGTVDTVSIYSNDMHKYLKCVVIKPDGYSKKHKQLPVVYLLHGYGGWYANMIIRIPQLKDYADTYQALLVCPEGAAGSWYFDSPADTAYRYESYIVKDVVLFIDKNYRTLASATHRAICGFSMGGHGALFLALRHPSVFGAAGAMSGGFDLFAFRNQFEISKRIGDTTQNASNWHDLSVINLVENYVNTPVKILFDCGNRDMFVEANRALHRKMIQLNIPHDYIERPGEHNWDYWRNALPYQLLYFSRFFSGYR